MPAAYKVHVDWIGNGFAELGDEVTGRVLDQRSPVTVRYGRDQARQLSPISPGEMSLELDNRSRDYSPENAASPIAGFVGPGRPVRLQATVGTNTTTLYTGYLDDFDIRPGVNDRSVPVSCIDALGRLRGVSLTTPLYRGIQTGTAIGYLLDAAGWPTDARDLDLGASILPFWWCDDQDAFDALLQLVDSEGPSALVTVDALGRIVFRDRHHRLTRAASLTSQATWRSSGAEPVISDPTTYSHGWKEIVNSVSVEVPQRTIDGQLSVVWSQQGQISVPPGGSVVVIAKAATAFLAAVEPVRDVDYTAPTGAVTVSLSQTSGQSTRITLTSAAGAVVQDLSLRAYAVQSSSVVVTAEDQPSITRYGRKSMDGRLPVWANAYDAAAIALLIVARRAERLPTLTVTMRGAGSPPRLAECLGRNLSDRVRLIEPLTGFDGDCYVEQIAHTVGQGGLEHVTTFGLEAIPPVVSTPLTFDVAGRGFNQGLFATPGVDNPATMFRFDQAGLGFDQGLFAT